MKHRSNVYPITQSDLPGNVIEKDMHYEHTGRRGAQKYLRENYYYRIKYSAANFLAASIWRRLMNSAALATSTHRGPDGVSDRTSTQVVAQMINKWRTKIVQRELYNMRDPPWRTDWKFIRESIVSS